MAIQVGDIKGSDGAFHHHYVPGFEGYEELTCLRQGMLGGEFPSVPTSALPPGSLPAIRTSLTATDLSQLSKAGIRGAKVGAALAESLESIPEPAAWPRASCIITTLTYVLPVAVAYAVIGIGLATIAKWVFG